MRPFVHAGRLLLRRKQSWRRLLPGSQRCTGGLSRVSRLQRALPQQYAIIHAGELVERNNI